MKKILAIILAVAMLASLAVICVSAEEKTWSAFGTVEADFDKDAATKLTMDGDTSDWAKNGYKSYELDQFNFGAWFGSVGEDWHITLYFTADANYFYVAFKIYDPVVKASDVTQYNGDAFQIQLDFNGSAAATEMFQRAVFYSFGYQEDGTIDLTIQAIGDDVGSIDYNITSADEEFEFDTAGMSKVQKPIKGACRLMEDGSGWEAEFGLAWQLIYGLAVEKLATNEKTEKIDFLFDAEHDITIPMLICYIDRDETGATVGAWQTCTKEIYDAGTMSTDGFAPENAGAKFILHGPKDDSTIAVDTTPVTEAEKTTAAETTAAETKAAATTVAETKATEETTVAAAEVTTAAAKKDSGCGSVIGAFAVLAVVTLAGVSIKKKH